MYLGDFRFGTTVNFKFTTVNATGAPVALSSAGVTVYRNNSTVQDATGVTLTASFDTITGLNHVLIDMATAGFYSSAGEYQAVISSGAGSENMAGYVLAHWSLVRRPRATVTTAVSISTASLISTAQAIATIGSLPADSSLASVVEWDGSTVPASTLVDTVNLTTAAAVQINAEADAAIETYNLDHLLGANGSSLNVVEGSLWARMTSSASAYTFKSSLHSLAVLEDEINAISTAANSSNVNVAEWRGIAPSTLGTNSHIRVSTTSAILSVATLPANSSIVTLDSTIVSTLVTAVNFTTLADMVNMTTAAAQQVNAEVDAAIETYNLDHLLAANGSSLNVTEGSLWARMTSSASAYTFKSSLHSLAVLEDEINAISTAANSSNVNVVEWGGSTVTGMPYDSSLVTSQFSTAGLETASSLVDVVNFTTAAAVQVNAEVDAAIETYNLDHLLAANGSSLNVVEGSLWARMTSSASAYTFKSSLHSLAVLEDEINAISTAANSSNVNVVEWGGSTVAGMPHDSSLVTSQFSTAGLETASSLVTAVNFSTLVTAVNFTTLADMVNITTAAAVQINAEVDAAIETYDLDHLLAANGSSLNVAEGSLWARMTSSASAYTFKSSLHSLAVLEDEINAISTAANSSNVNLVEWRGETPSTLFGSSWVRAQSQFSTVGLETASSLVTAENFSTLVTAVNFTTLADVVNVTTAAAVQINAEVDAAIETYNLDHLLGANGSSLNVAEGSLWARMTSSASAYTFKSSLHSLAVLEDEINAVYGSSVVTLDSTLVEAANFSTAGLETASSLVAVVEWNGSTVPASTLVDMVNMTTAAAVQVNAEVADVINTDTHAEPGRGTVPPAAPSLSGMVRHLYFPMRHSFDIHSSGRIFRDSSGGVAWVKPLTDAGSTYVEGLATTAT